MAASTAIFIFGTICISGMDRWNSSTAVLET